MLLVVGLPQGLCNVVKNLSCFSRENLSFFFWLEWESPKKLSLKTCKATKNLLLGGWNFRLKHHLNSRQVWFDAIKKAGQTQGSWFPTDFVPEVSEIPEGFNLREGFLFLSGGIQNLPQAPLTEPQPRFMKARGTSAHFCSINFSEVGPQTTGAGGGPRGRERGEITQALPPQKQPGRGVCSSVWPQWHPRIVKSILKCLNCPKNRIFLIFTDEEWSDHQFSSSENFNFYSSEPKVSPKRSRVYLRIQIESSWCFNQKFPEHHTLFQGSDIVPLQLQSSSNKIHKEKSRGKKRKCSPVTLEQQENLKMPRAVCGHQAGFPSNSGYSW